jgi:SAM-dependent methyltransferase
MRPRRMRRLESELVEVVVGGLDLAIVAHLVPEPEERVLDRAARLRDRVQMSNRERLSGQRDVDDLLAQPPVELVVGEDAPVLLDGRLEALPDAVEEHAGLAIAHASQRLCKLALATEVAHTRLFELVRRLGTLDCRVRFLLVRLPVHGGETIQGMSVYDRIARLYDSWSASVVEDVGFYVEEARRAGGPVLELGVGTGRIAVPTALAGIDVVGVDSSAGMLEVARERAELAGVELDLRLGDLRDPPVEETFPLVTIPFRSLLHMETDDDRRAALRAVDRLLEPAGRLVFDVFAPAADDIAETQGRWLEREPGIWERADWDERTRTLVLRLRGRGAESEMSLAWLSVPEWRELLFDEGLVVDTLYGWFDRTPWRGGEDSIWVCRRKG